VRAWINEHLAAWGRWSYDHPWPIIAAVTLLVAILSLQIPSLEMDTSTEGFLHEGDPLRISYDEFRNQFGRDDQVMLAIETPNVFDRDFLARLRELHEAIEDEVPSLEEVSSLINARYTRGKGDELVVGDLLEDPPESDADLARIESIARGNPMYQNLLLSEDARYATILVRTSAYSSLGEVDPLAGFDDPSSEPAGGAPERKFITGPENDAVVHALDAIVERFDAEGFRIYMAGAPAMMETMQRAMLHDMAIFTSLAVVVIVFALAFLFRGIAGVVMPLVAVVLSLLATLSIMSLSGTPITVPTQILPSFLLAVGVGYSVHILAIFYQQRRAGVDERASIAHALGHSGLAILMTSLTTAGGLISFSAAELAPVADFGIFGPIGVVMALFFTIVLLPPLTAVFPMGQAGAAGRERGERASQRVLVRVGNFAYRRAPFVTVVASGILVVAMLGALQLRFSHDPISWFPEDDFFRVSNDLMNEELKGSMFLEATIDTGVENGLHDPELLHHLDELRRRMSALQVEDVIVGKVLSVLDVVKETNQALNENRPEAYAVPDDRQLIAQELLLFENSGSDDLEDLVDSQFSMARITVKTSMTDGIQYDGFIRRLDRMFHDELGDDVDYEFTGLMMIMGGTINAMIRTMARAYLIALAIITPLLVLVIGRLRVGLVAMVPNLAPILITLGLMGWVGIPIDAFTLLIGSIAIGLAVDDTIHFMHHFRANFEATGDVQASIERTLHTTGQALLYTSVVLASGFFIYVFATMSNMVNFGFLTGLTIILAFLADLILAPALLTLVVRPARPRSVGHESRSAEMEVPT